MLRCEVGHTSFEISFFKKRFYVKNGHRMGVIPRGVRIDPGTKDNPGGEKFVVDTVCTVTVSDPQDRVSGYSGEAMMNPVDTGKYDPVKGRKRSLKRALDAAHAGGTNHGFGEPGLHKLVRAEIWRQYFNAFPRR